MAATTLSPARAIRAPRRVDLRLVVGIFLALAALAGSVSFWTVTSESRAVLVATRDLPAGATLRTTDLAVTRVRVDDAIYQAALPADALDVVAGRQLAKPALTRQMLVRAQLSSRSALEPGQLAMTVPIRSPSWMRGSSARKNRSPGKRHPNPVKNHRFSPVVRQLRRRLRRAQPLPR